MTPHPVLGRVAVSLKTILSLALERVTPNPRITPREPLRWVMVNAAWEWAIQRSMMTPRLIVALGREDRIAAALGVSATLGRVMVGVDLARVARPIPMMTLRSAAALTQVDRSPASTSGTVSVTQGRVIVGVALGWVARPSSRITPRMTEALGKVVPIATMEREEVSMTVEWVMVCVPLGTVGPPKSQSMSRTFGRVTVSVASGSVALSSRKTRSVNATLG